MWGKRSPGDEDDDNYDAEELDDADNNDERSHKTYRINPDFGKKSLLNSIYFLLVFFYPREGEDDTHARLGLLQSPLVLI